MAGLDEVGLYRVKAGEDVDMDDEQWIDVNIVAGTFKSWLRELPESILTPELYDKFIQGVGITDYEEKCYAIKNLIFQLPTGSFNLLRRVIQHLKKYILPVFLCSSVGWRITNL